MKLARILIAILLGLVFVAGQVVCTFKYADSVNEQLEIVDFVDAENALEGEPEAKLKEDSKLESLLPYWLERPEVLCVSDLIVQSKDCTPHPAPHPSDTSHASLPKTPPEA